MSGGGHLPRWYRDAARDRAPLWIVRQDLLQDGPRIVGVCDFGAALAIRSRDVPRLARTTKGLGPAYRLATPSEIAAALDASRGVVHYATVYRGTAVVLGEHTYIAHRAAMAAQADR